MSAAEEHPELTERSAQYAHNASTVLDECIMFGTSFLVTRWRNGKTAVAVLMPYDEYDALKNQLAYLEDKLRQEGVE